MKKKYSFSRTSIKRLSTCEKKIQKVFELAIKRTEIDFGIACGERSVSEQQQLYAQGRTGPGPIVTYVDGINKKSEHNYSPSRAVDIYAFVDGKATWNEKYLIYLGGVITACAIQLGVSLTWGGNWDNDGIIINDQNFQDLPHYQLK